MPFPNDDEKDEEEKKMPPRPASPPPDSQVMDDRGDDGNNNNNNSGPFTMPRRNSETATLGQEFESMLYQNPQDPNYVAAPQPQPPQEPAFAPSPQAMEERLQDYDTQSSLANSSLSASFTTDEEDDFSGSLSYDSASISEDDSNAATANNSWSSSDTLSSSSEIAFGSRKQMQRMNSKMKGRSHNSLDDSLSISFGMSDSDDEWVVGAGMYTSIRAADMKKIQREKNSTGMTTHRSTNMDRFCTLVWDCCTYTTVFCCVLLFDSR